MLADHDVRVVCAAVVAVFMAVTVGTTIGTYGNHEATQAAKAECVKAGGQLIPGGRHSADWGCMRP